MTSPSTRTIALPAPADKMGFDGERFVTGVPGAIAHEHYLRYLFAMQFCAGKLVLDIASGEGYGSSLLGQVAARVSGTDLLPEAVDFARRNYGTDTVSFSQGDVRDIPHPDASFDVVVSFETLEHVAEHERFLAEIRRVLRPGGLMVLSSPNRDVYLRSLPPNPFHKREPNRDEFVALVAQHFAQYRLGQQRSLIGAVLLPEGQLQADRFTSFVMDGGQVDCREGVGNATYLVAVASDGAIPDIDWGVLADVNYLQQLMDSHAEGAKTLLAQTDYLTQEQGLFKAEIARLTTEMAARQADIGRLLTDIDYLQGEKTALQAEVDRTTQEAQASRTQFEALVSSATALRGENATLMAEILRLTEGKEAAEAQIAAAEARFQEDLQKQRKQLLMDVLEIFS